MVLMLVTLVVPQIWRLVNEDFLAQLRPRSITGKTSRIRQIFQSMLQKTGVPNILSSLNFLRASRFSLFDGLRTLVRPGMPSLSILITLMSAFALMCVFLTMTITFRDKLTISESNSTNLYAINLLEADAPKIIQKYGS